MAAASVGLSIEARLEGGQLAAGRAAVVAATAPQSLSMLVLAAGRGGCVGVDLSCGAFVMAHWSDGAAPGLAALDVAVAPRCGSGGFGVARVPRVPAQASVDPVRPEAVAVKRAPVRVGRLRPRLAERRLRPLLLPEREHILGFAGSSVPYWTLTGERPSLCLVEPAGGVTVTAERTCRFRWKGALHELPLAEAAVPAVRRGRAAGGTALAEMLGFVPRRLVVALTPPRSGVCHKVVPALLP